MKYAYPCYISETSFSDDAGDGDFDLQVYQVGCGLGDGYGNSEVYGRPTGDGGGNGFPIFCSDIFYPFYMLVKT